MDLARSLFQPQQQQKQHQHQIEPQPLGAVSKEAASSARPRSAMPTTTSNHFLSLLFFHESTSWSTSGLVNEEQLKNFQFLKRTFESALAILVRDRNRQQQQQQRQQHQLVILCPVQQSLMGVDALSNLEWEWGGIDEEFILSHIVRVPDRDQPMARGLSVTTLNGRTLIVTDTTVTTAKGFKLLKQARLISEQIFYDNEGRGWVIQFIDRPLVGVPQEQRQSPSSPTSPDESNVDGGRSRFSALFGPTLRSESPFGFGSGFRRRSNQRADYIHGARPRLYDSLRKSSKGRPSLTLQTALQRFPGVSQKLEQLIMDFNDDTMVKTNLKDIRTAVDRLLSDSVELLNNVDSKAMSALLEGYGVTVERLDQLLENYIMNSTYDIVFFKITLQLKQQDWDLSEAVRELRNLDLGQVGLPDTPQHHQCLVSALNEFQSIGVLRTPEEKLSCLVQSVRVTSTLSGGADDLIPILLLTVLRSGISNLASNLYYMKNFVLFGDPTRGEYGYSLSTLEAVSRYIASHVKQLSPLSNRNQEYWEKVCSGDLEGVKTIYSEAAEAKRDEIVSSSLPRRPSAASLDSNSDIVIDPTILDSLAASPLQSRDTEGNNDILLACKAQQIEMLRYLLEEQGGLLNVCNYEGRTPLMISVDLENLEMTRLILGAMATKGSSSTINKQDVLGNTALHVCMSKGHLEILKGLLKFDPDLGLPNNEGDTPLIIAAKLSDKDRTRHARTISTLAQHMKPEEFDRQNNSGDTASHFIVDPTTIAELSSRGANPDVENYAGWTPLLKWVLHDNTSVVESLLVTGKVDTLAADSRGYTPLHMACLRGNLEMVRMLQIHTPVDLQSPIDGSTPLQLACQSGSAAVVEYLLQKSANPELRDWTNEAPADMTSDAAILDMLDNAMLFWYSEQHYSDPVSALSSCFSKPTSQNEKRRKSLDEPGKRVIRVVRGAMEQDGKIRYIVKSGSTSDPSTIVTMPRSLDDFRFLKQNLLIEGPDACIPSLENFYSPFLLSPSRPSKTVLAISARRLDMFLNYLSNHPVLANHELIWEFMLMPELQREMIAARSLSKQENSIDSIFDNFPATVENLEHEETYFKYLNDEILNLEKAVQQVRKCARKLSRSAQDVPQQLEILTEVLDRSYLISFESKSEHIQAIKAIASTQTTMHTSDIESLGNLFEDFSFVIDGTLKALKHPQEIIASIRQLRVAAQKAEQSMRRNDSWWSGLSSIGEGAMTAFGGAGAALGAVGHAATSTFEAVSGSIAAGGEGIGGRGMGGQHSRAASESMARKPSGSKTVSSPPMSPKILSKTTGPSPSPSPSPSQSPPPPPLTMHRKASSLVVKLSPSPSSSQIHLSGAATIGNSATPGRTRSRQSTESTNKTLATASSLLASPFSSIAAVASAATGQMSSEEIKDKIDKASSLLNSLRGSLFEELAHLQNHHTKELERAMRDFGARQLQIEKSRLRDMLETLNDLRIESSANAAAAAAATATGVVSTSGSGLLGPQSLRGSTWDLSAGQVDRGISRQSSIQGMNSNTVGSLNGDGTRSELDFVIDEKAEARAQQRQQRKNNVLSDAISGEHGSPSVSRKRSEDTMSEKVPFDD